MFSIFPEYGWRMYRYRPDRAFSIRQPDVIRRDAQHIGKDADRNIADLYLAEIPGFGYVSGNGWRFTRCACIWKRAPHYMGYMSTAKEATPQIFNREVILRPGRLLNAGEVRIDCDSRKPPMSHPSIFGERTILRSCAHRCRKEDRDMRTQDWGRSEEPTRGAVACGLRTRSRRLGTRN